MSDYPSHAFDTDIDSDEDLEPTVIILRFPFIANMNALDNEYDVAPIRQYTPDNAPPQHRADSAPLDTFVAALGRWFGRASLR